jgi:hypothetical protein
MQYRRIILTASCIVAAVACVALSFSRVGTRRVQVISPVFEEMNNGGTRLTADGGSESNEHSLPDDAGIEDAAVVEIDEERLIQGDVLKPMDMLYHDRLQYLAVPAISVDGKMAFFVQDTTTVFTSLGLTAMLVDVDSNAVVWQKIILAPNECSNPLAPSCVQLVNDRQREANAYLASLPVRGWITPERCKLKTLYPRHESKDCVPVDFPQDCAPPGLTFTFRTPRLRAVTASGSVIVDREFPPWAPPDVPACLPTNRPYPKAWGFDLKRRVMFVMLEYCEEGCGHPPLKVLHVFRLPDLGSTPSSPLASPDGGG